MTLGVRAASAIITPERPCELAGYASRRDPFVAVEDPLELNAVLLEQSDSAVLVFSADVLYLSDTVRVGLVDRLRERGFGDCAVVAAASHTHFAPAVDPSKPRLGEPDPGFLAAFLAASRTLVDSLCDTAARSCRLHHSRVEVSLAVNRRRRGWVSVLPPRRGTVMRPEPRRPVDRELHVVRVESNGDGPLAVLWSWGCHPVGFPHPERISAEFPGAVRSRLRAEAGSALPVAFLQGFSGDVRPPALRPAGSNPIGWAERALNGPRFGRFSPEAYSRWTRLLADRVLDGFRSASPVGEALRCGRGRTPLGELLEEARPGSELEVQRVVLGDRLQLIGVGAEVVAGYAAEVRALYPGWQTLLAGCVGSTFGYLPTSDMLREGGYEAGGFLPSFSLEGGFRPAVEERFLEQVSELQG